MSQFLADQEQIHFTSTDTSQAFQEDSLLETVKPQVYFAFKVANTNDTVPPQNWIFNHVLLAFQVFP